jgi:hypothetical protein
MVEHDTNLEQIPQIGVIEIDTICAPCISVPYDLPNHNPELYYLILEPRSIWKNLFVQFLKDQIQVLE